MTPWLAIWQAACGTLFTWAVTALGASLVFVGSYNRKYLDGSLGFAAGVMLAASFWSLLAPALELAALYKDAKKQSNEVSEQSWRRTMLLALAVTVHNIPEGLAVGVAFGSIGSAPSATYASARNLAIAIGLQNFPEGMAVSIPLHRTGLSRRRAFFYGQLSGCVEPIAGILGALLVTLAAPLLPYALSFAAGAMVFVVFDDIIPETCSGPNAKLANWCAMLGFVVMMALDVGLG